MKKNQLFGGILMLFAGAITLFFAEIDSSVPLGLSLMVVGTALVAVSRKRGSLQ